MYINSYAETGLRITGFQARPQMEGLGQQPSQNTFNLQFVLPTEQDQILEL